MQKTSLFLETGFSFNGSNILIEPLIEKATELGYTTLALTDNKMHAVYKFYTKCIKANITPIIGLQVSLVALLNGSTIEVVCYAKSTKGYKNLLMISSLQSYQGPLNLKDLARFNTDVSIVIRPDMGETYNALTNPSAYKQITHELKSHLDNLYLGVHPNLTIPDVSGLNTLAIDYVKYMNKEDYPYKATLSTILHKNQEPIFEETLPGHFKALDELTDEKSVDTFIQDHTFSLDLTPPTLPTYKHTQGLSSHAFLKALSHKGLKKRLLNTKKKHDVYLSRLNNELSVINELGYDDYFLIVWDVIKYAKKANILVGPGRGSAPGSLVAYVLGITDIDPIEHDLLFERFLNKARKNMPDIDIDFPDHAREKIIKYTAETFGEKNVSYICTFGTFLKKSALRESVKLFNLETKHSNEIIKTSDNYDTIASMIDENLDVLNRMDQNPQINDWLTHASKLEGLPKHIGTHAAGIIISNLPITQYSALQPGLDNHPQTQFEQTDLEALGLLKMDFLGLRNLTMIETILNDIKKGEGKTITIQKVPLNDEPTFKLLRDHSTSGIFQLESLGMRRLIKDMQIKSFEDIVVILALFRPGPMESIPTYLNRRHKGEKPTYLHESLKPILSKTEGILLYQEQIMAIASTFANYSMSEADLLRRAVSKKDEFALKEERARFVKKAKSNNHSEALANELYDYIVKFANYGFNKSHSVAYALISYWMAYLKANYPAYFIGVLMQSALSSETTMREYIQDAMQLGIAVLGPDINISKDRFVLHDNCLYYPLTGIKNIGKSVYDKLNQHRDKPFKTFNDFLSVVGKDINKRSLEYLIYSGALDVFDLTKQTMIKNTEAMLHFIDYQGMHSLNDFKFQTFPEFDQETLKAYEADALGFNLSYDPLKAYLQHIKTNNLKTVELLQTAQIDHTYNLLAIITRIKTIKTKNGDAMAFVTLEDKTSSMDAVLFPRTYTSVQSMLKENTVYEINGKLTLKKNERQLIINRMKAV